MAIPNFSKFRLGDPLSYTDGGALRYSDLKDAGLQDHYIRIIYKLVSTEKATQKQVKGWLTQASSGDRVTGRVLRDELESLMPKPPEPPKKKITKKRAGSRAAKREKVFTLHSKGNHKKALKLASEYNLRPAPVAKTALRPGQSAEAQSVQAAEHIASKLITTGYWSTAD